MSIICHLSLSSSYICWNKSSLRLSVIRKEYVCVFYCHGNSQKRKHKREIIFFFGILKCSADEFWIGCKWKWKMLRNYFFFLLLLANLFSTFFAVAKKTRLFAIINSNFSLFLGLLACRAQLRFLPDCDASSTQEQISSLVQHFRANQKLFGTAARSKYQNGMSEGGLRVNYWIWKKPRNCCRWSPHVPPVLCPIQHYSVGWGKVNQHNAESCCLYFACQTANKHKWFFNDRPLYPTKLSTHKH